MSAHPTPNATDHHRQVLDDLIDLGHELARILVQTARSQTVQTSTSEHPTPETRNPDHPAPLSAPNIAIAFDRVARSVRRCILLTRTLDQPTPQPGAAPGPRPAHPGRTAARQKIIREIEDSIGYETGGPEAHTLHAELRERLDAPDLDDDIATRPIADIIEDIRRDLGLGNLVRDCRRYKRRTPAEFAILHARAAAPPGAASAPELAITFLPPPPSNDHSFESSKTLALMLASTRTRGK